MSTLYSILTVIRKRKLNLNEKRDFSFLKIVKEKLLAQFNFAQKKNKN